MALSIPKLNYQARRLHRFLVVILSLLGLTMMATGTMMKYPGMFPSFDFFTVRNIHSQISTFFSITFILMAITGIFMYITPWLIQKFPPTSRSV